VVLPEELCLRLAALAEDESRTVSNMAKVLIQQGVERLERDRDRDRARTNANDGFRAELERRGSRPSRPPRRLRLRPPGS
jgi:hypothetical protein